jgi:hypothetical protein
VKGIPIPEPDRHSTRYGRDWHRRRKEPDCAACAATRVRKPVACCGTEPGVKRHRRLGESVCRPCQDAKNAANRARYTALATP